MTEDDQKMPKNADRYNCKLCGFVCSKKSNWEKHLLTLKHENGYQWLLSSSQKMPKNAENATSSFICECGKRYKYKQGLWRHKKICENNNNGHLKCLEYQQNELICLLLKEHKDFKHLLMEQSNQIIELSNKTGNIITNTTNNTNSHNKTFNLNMFLNETCKNAMNISDFANSIQLNLSDLEDVGELGYVNGISNIIVKNLKALDITQRPIHCTDAKREILYVKDDNKWEKENDHNDKIVKFVKDVANKNIRMLNEFKKKYPDCIKSQSNKSDQYNKLVIEAMGGQGFNYDDQHKKIIKKISKEVTIDKVTV